MPSLRPGGPECRRLLVGLDSSQTVRHPLPNPSHTFPSWPASPEQPSLESDQVHIWGASLEQPLPTVDRLREHLSPDEQARAARFHFEKDRRHFTVARGYLRTLLGRYCGLGPDEIRFSYSSYGKPRLTVELQQPIEFSLAHSGGAALYAFTRIGEIGIDLEYIRPDFIGDDIARRYFSASEVASLNLLSKPDRQKAFFACWARKEAFIKAKGLGLSLGLDQFDVALRSDQPVAILRTAWEEAEALRWSLQAIDVGPDYAAAVALEAHGWQANYWQVE